jgi:hypothetical protein
LLARFNVLRNLDFAHFAIEGKKSYRQSEVVSLSLTSLKVFSHQKHPTTVPSLPSISTVLQPVSAVMIKLPKNQPVSTCTSNTVKIVVL